MSNSETRVPKPSREMLAYHEAGHAVVALLVSVPMDDVSIEGTGESLGRVMRAAQGDRHVSSGQLHALVERDIEILHAGACSLDRRFGPGAQKVFGAGNDYSEMRRLVALLDLDSTQAEDALIERARNRTDDMLAHLEHWAAVDAVAAALLERGALSGDEVREIVAQHVTTLPR
jgi:ATP-dependent Zn protease